MNCGYRPQLRRMSSNLRWFGCLVGFFLSQTQKVTHQFYYYQGCDYGMTSDTFVDFRPRALWKAPSNVLSSFPQASMVPQKNSLPHCTGEDTGSQGIRVPVPGPHGDRYEPRIAGFHLASSTTGQWCFFASPDVPVFCLISMSYCNNQGKNKQTLGSVPWCVAYKSTVCAASLQFLSQRHSLLATVACTWGHPQDALACVPPSPPLLTAGSAIRV